MWGWDGALVYVFWSCVATRGHWKLETVKLQFSALELFPIKSRPALLPCVYSGFDILSELLHWVASLPLLRPANSHASDAQTTPRTSFALQNLVSDFLGLLPPKHAHRLQADPCSSRSVSPARLDRANKLQGSNLPNSQFFSNAVHTFFFFCLFVDRTTRGTQHIYSRKSPFAMAIGVPLSMGLRCELFGLHWKGYVIKASFLHAGRQCVFATRGSGFILFLF